MIRRQKISPIKWRATSPTKPPTPKVSSPVKSEIETKQEKKPRQPSGSRKLAAIRRPSAIKPGKIIAFSYRRPWAWDPNPVVFTLYATTKAAKDAYIEGINVRYMSAKYWSTLEEFVTKYPNAGGEFVYLLIKGSEPQLLKAYRRYLYKRIISEIRDASSYSETKTIRRKMPRDGEFIR